MSGNGASSGSVSGLRGLLLLPRPCLGLRWVTSDRVVSCSKKSLSNRGASKNEGGGDGIESCCTGGDLPVEGRFGVVGGDGINKVYRSNPKLETSMVMPARQWVTQFRTGADTGKALMKTTHSEQAMRGKASKEGLVNLF